MRQLLRKYTTTQALTPLASPAPRHCRQAGPQRGHGPGGRAGVRRRHEAADPRGRRRQHRGLVLQDLWQGAGPPPRRSGRTCLLMLYLVPVYPYTLTSSSSQAGHSFPYGVLIVQRSTYPYTLAASSSPAGHLFPRHLNCHASRRSRRVIRESTNVYPAFSTSKLLKLSRSGNQ